MSNFNENILPVVVPAHLLDKVMFGIRTERARLMAIRRLIVSSSLCLVAAIALIPVWNAFYAAFRGSDFSQFAKLLFVDFQAVLTNWQDYSLSLLESFPIANAAALLFAVALLLASLKFIFKYSRGLSPLHRLKLAASRS